MMVLLILLIVLFVEIMIVISWKSKVIAEARKASQDETDLRLTYKRYKELYPDVTLSYSEYKQLQARRAYKKAVSSMKIKRMVR